jgi:hypothetical protein
MHNARSFPDGRSIPPLRILYAFMMCKGASALVLPSNSLFGKNPFCEVTRSPAIQDTPSILQYPKNSTTWTTRQWQFEFELNLRYAVRSQFYILLYPFDLTMGRTLLQAKIPSMRGFFFPFTDVAGGSFTVGCDDASMGSRIWRLETT